MKKHSNALLFALLWLVASPPALKAQLVWKVTHTDYFPDNSRYHFSAICSYGFFCTVAGIEPTMSPPYYQLVFEQSYDGGRTWTQRVPPVLGDFGFGKFYIRKLYQVDSLHIVGLADSADVSSFVIQTSDGGKTWKRMSLPTAWYITDVHFSDPATGILITAGGTKSQPDGNLVFTTSDGGDHWIEYKLSFRSYPEACHSYGHGMFRVWAADHGPLYITHNNWATYDSSAQPFDTVTDPHYNWIIGHSNFGDGDTIIGFGVHIVGSPNDMHANGAITRTTDGGKSWTSFPIADSVGAIHSMSSLTRDTIYASGSSGAHRMLRSTDRGASWSLDSVLLDTAYEFVAANGLTVMADGHPVGLFSQSSYDVDPSAIFRGEWEPARVEIYERIFYGTHLYPNPATTEFTITSVDPSRPVHVFDMIGRELLHDVLDTRGVATLDISRLPRGVYSVVLDHYGKLLPVGKVAVVGR